MDTDSSVAVGSTSASCSEDEVASSLTKKKVTRFSVAQRACLNSYWFNGLTGCGKRHAALISQAASDAQLSIQQVKVVN